MPRDSVVSLQRLCGAVNDSLSDDVHIAVLNVLLQLSHTVAVANLSPDACRILSFIYLNSTIESVIFASYFL